MKLRHLGLTAVLSLCAAGSAFAADAVMRISHPLPPSHHIAKIVEQFATDVEKNSGGKVDVQIFGSDQAFKANQNHAAVARGQMEAAVVTNFQWGGTIPEMNVMTIPYFMSTLDKVKAFPGSEVAKILDAKLEEKGVRNIAWMYVTREAIFTSANKAIVKPEDFQGLKIRGLNKLVDNGLVAAGAAPASMPGSEVYQALQTGVIDAGLTDVSAAVSRRFYEVQKFGTVTPFFVAYFHMFVNPKWLDGQPEDVRKVILDAAKKAEIDAIDATEKSAASARKELEEKGMTLVIHTPEQAEAFKNVMQKPVLDAFMESTADGKKLIDLANQL